VNDCFAAVVQSKRDASPPGRPAAERSGGFRQRTGAGLPGIGPRRRHAVQQRQWRGAERPRFWPLYEAANDLGALLYIHPTHPLGVEAMTDFWLMRWWAS